MEPTSVIGERLREIRTKQDLSLDDAAKLTGVSKPMLGQIERGKSIPTITTLWKIATGLKTPLSSFMQEQQAEYSVVKCHSQKPIIEDSGRMRAYPVFPYDPIRSVELFYIEFDADCSHVSAKHNNGVEEYIMVLSGQLRLVLNGEAILIQKNEAIRFRADIPHEYHNPFSEGCSAYNMIFYPG